MKTKTACFFLILFIVVSASGCFSGPIDGNNLNLTNFKQGLFGKNNLSSSNKGFITPEIFLLLDNPDPIKISGEIPDSREDLSKMRMVVKIYDGDKNAGIAIPGFGGLKLGTEESNLNVYYIETKIVINGADSIVYGCGYSLHYLFKKVKKGISIDNLPSVAASAQLNSNKTQVYYSLQTYGVSGINLVKYFKPTINKNFNVDGFGIMQSSIDGIHNILGDTVLAKTVKFEPEILKFIKPYELEQTE